MATAWLILVAVLVIVNGLAQIPDLDVYTKEAKEACKASDGAPPGCSLLESCQDHRQKGICSPQSIWNDVCSDDVDALHKDGVCIRYKSSCVTAKPPKDECNSGLPSLLKTSKVRALIKQMCMEMPNMKACKACAQGTCGQPFESAYLPLCASMPGMQECVAWRNLCNVATYDSVRAVWRCPVQPRENDAYPSM